MVSDDSKDRLARYASLLEASLESTADGILVVDLKGRPVKFNRPLAAIWNVPFEDFASATLEMAIRSIEQRVKAPDAFLARFQEILKTPDLESFDVLEFKDGRIIERLTVPQRIGSKVIGRVCSFRDMSERYQVERALKESEERLQKIIANTPNVAIEIFDRNGRVLFWNPAAEKIFGFAREEALGKRLNQLILDEAATREFEQALLNMEASEEVLGPTEWDIRRKDGSVGTLISTTFPITHTTGKMFVCMDVDITDRRLAEARTKDALERERRLSAELDAAKQRAELLGDFSNKLSQSLDLQEVCTTISNHMIPRFADWCFAGISEDEFKMRVRHACHSDPTLKETARQLEGILLQTQGPCGFCDAICEGEAKVFPVASEDALVSKEDEATRQLILKLGVRSCMVFPLRARGKSLGVIVFVSNDPERTYSPEHAAELEEMVRRGALMIDNALLYETAQKAVRLREEFISVASHELRTPLTSMRMRLELLDTLSRQGNLLAISPAQLQSLAKNSLTDVDRLVKLVSVLLDVSRLGAGNLTIQPTEVDLSRLVTDVASAYKAELDSFGCPLVLRVDPGISGFWDSTRLEQALVNLLANARKFGRGKPIEVTLKKEALRTIEWVEPVESARRGAHYAALA